MEKISEKRKRPDEKSEKQKKGKTTAEIREMNMNCTDKGIFAPKYTP